MRSRLVRSPWWVLGAWLALFFGTVITILNALGTGRWLPALLGALVGAAFFGVVMGLLLARQNRRLFVDTQDLTRPELGAVIRASGRGPVPADPRLRAAAADLTRRRLDQSTRYRGWSLAVFAALVVLYAALALRWAPTAWIGVGVFGLALVLSLGEPARLRRRLETLVEG